MHTYGDTNLPTQPTNNKVTYSASTGNGTSNFSTSGSVTEEITCAWTDRATNTPALFAAWATDATYLLTEAIQEQLPLGLCKITLTYTAAATSVPATSYSEQTSQVEEPIQTHPSFSSWAADWDDTAQAFIPSSTKYGITSYVKGTTTVTKTEYYNSRPSKGFANVGKLQTPGGDYTESGQYLIIGCSRSQQAALWLLTTVYQYSAVAYNTDIYSAA